MRNIISQNQGNPAGDGEEEETNIFKLGFDKNDVLIVENSPHSVLSGRFKGNYYC